MSADQTYLIAALPGVSRTFAPSIEALPAGLREAVRVAYLLCRIIDTIEDHPRLAHADRHRLFAAFERVAAGADDPAGFEGDPAWADAGDDAELALCHNAGAVIRCFQALPPAARDSISRHALEMLRGMREYTLRAARLEIRDLEDLERYCYFVAGTVGKLLTELFLAATPGVSPGAQAGLHARAVAFGVGLQLVNILKDAPADLARGVSFMPDGLGRERLVERAREHLRSAREYTLGWPASDAAPIRLFCAVPLALGLATLGHLPKVSRELFGRILAEAPVAVQSDLDLARFLDAFA